MKPAARFNAGFFYVTVVLLSSACGAGSSEATSSQDSESSKLEKTLDVTAANKSIDESADANETSPTVKWELKIEGMPVLSGPTLVKFYLGDTTKFSMMSADAMTTIDLQKGTSDPATFNTVFSSSNMSCLYGTQDKHKSSGINIVLSDTGGEFSGEITCWEAGNADAEKMNHTVSGWFINAFRMN